MLILLLRISRLLHKVALFRSESLTAKFELVRVLLTDVLLLPTRRQIFANRR